MVSSSTRDTGSSTLEMYPETAWFCLSIFFFIVGLFQWGSVLHSKLVKRPSRRVCAGSRDEEATSPPPACPSNGGSLKRVPIAAVNVFRVIAFRYTVKLGPYELKLAEVFLAITYIAFLLTLTFINETDMETQRLSIPLWGGRAGVVAASQFPLVTALGTKNNIVSFVTGISYEKLNFFHRVSARTSFGLLLIHVGRELYTLQLLRADLQETWLMMGITAVVSLGILCIISVRPVRALVYEVFFYSHFVLVFIFLLGAYFHTKHSHVSYWIWPCFMFWALDRFMRFVRLVVHNHLYFGFGGRDRMLHATTELLSDDYIRVSVRRPPHFQWSPGQTAYLIMPSVSTLPIETHPFSISTVDSALFRPRGEGVRRTGSHDGWKELVFLINVRGGFTKRLKEAAEEHESIKVLIDGPYGPSPDLGAYDTSILIAGGSGITYTLPVLLSIIEAARERSSNCRRVVFIWAVRDASHINWIADTLVQANSLAPRSLDVVIRIFATKSSSPSSESDSMFLEPTPIKERAAEGLIPPCISMENGRPDLKSILGEEVQGTVGRMSVSVCGSQSLAKSVRCALRFPVSGLDSILRGGPSVTLHVESFGYA